MSTMIQAIRQAERERDAYLAEFGCTDGNCIVAKPKLAHTNGGCHCYRVRHVMQRLAYAHTRFAETVSSILSAATTQPRPPSVLVIDNEVTEGMFTEAIKSEVTSGEIVKLPDTATPKGIRLSNFMRDGTENGTYDVVVEVQNAQGEYVEAIREFGGHMEVSFDHFVSLPLAASDKRTNPLVDTTDWC